MAAKRLFIITGDYSGDIHAANVVRELRKSAPELQIAAVGGENLRTEGVELVTDQSKMGKHGISSLMSVPYHYLLGRKVLKFLAEFKPDAVLLIDYGMFNLWIAQQLKQWGIPAYYFIPPQVWATRKGRIHKIKAHVDHVFCIFPFEQELYESHGIPVTYVGHPLVGQLPPPANRDAFFQKYGLDPNRPLISLFPGSRKQEVELLIPAVLEAAALIRQQRPDVQFALTRAASIPTDFFQVCLNKARALPTCAELPSIPVVENENHALLSVSDVTLVKSGTTTLEAALYDTPQVLLYKMNPLAYEVAIRIFPFPCLGLPNILTDMQNPIIRELVQRDANPATITEAALPLLDSASPEYQKAKAGYAEIRQKLKGDAPANVAEGILTLLSEA